LRALVLCAGFGTRFRPATLTTPKPLLPLLGVPILEHLLLHLARQGVTRAVLNAHHLAEALRARVGGSCAGLPVDWSFEDPILGTAGAIRRAAEAGLLPEEPFIVANGDLFTTLTLRPLLSALEAPEALSALAVLPNERPGIDTPLWAGAGGRLVAVGGPRPDGAATGPWLFTGLQAARRALVEWIPAGFSELARDVMVPSARRGDGGFVLVPYRPGVDGLWFDLGTPERLAAAEEALRRQTG
jgi:NDP-sugar pyrophosphorylase family protein